MRLQAYSYIRMSTEQQLKGNSLQRQTDLSEAYAAENGLDLSSERFSDLGVSAYRGKNKIEGALGSFLKAIEHGAVPQGSYLLVESLDRLSREHVGKAANLFFSIMHSGITIVTLSDNRVYNAANSDLSDLMWALVSMQRAFEESEIKSKRVLAAWRSKRSIAGSKKLTSRSPSWLVLDKSSDMFRIDEGLAKVVREIYALADSGFGSFKIMRVLNSRSIPSLGNGSDWGVSSISAILTDRSVLGEFQAHRMDGKRRVPEGNPISGYFPQIISIELFSRVQAERARRRNKAGGRKGDKYSNLFGRVLQCGYCSAPMHYRNPGRGNGKTKLVCSKALKGSGCVKNSWPYDHFETSFLAYVKELDLSKFTDDDSGDSERELDLQINTNGALISTLSSRITRLTSLYADIGGDIVEISKQVRDITEQKAEYEKVDQTLRNRRAEIVVSRAAFVSAAQNIATYAGSIHLFKDDFETRSKLAGMIFAVVSSVRLSASGCLPSTDEFLKCLRSDVSIDTRARIRPFINLIASISGNPVNNYPFFRVSFKHRSEENDRVLRVDPLNPYSAKRLRPPANR